jgi:hypothetical protein
MAQILFTSPLHHRGSKKIGSIKKFTLIYDMNFVTSPFRTSFMGIAFVGPLEDIIFSPRSLFFCLAGLSLYQIARLNIKKEMGVSFYRSQ